MYLFRKLEDAFPCEPRHFIHPTRNEPVHVHKCIDPTDQNVLSKNVSRFLAAMGKRATKVGTLLTLFALGGCGTAPLSFIEDQQVYDGPLSRHFPLTVIALDGSFYGNNSKMRPVQVGPGIHSIIFGPTRSSRALTLQRTFAFKTLACTRYYVAGDFIGPNEKDWELVIEKVEPVRDCSPEDEAKK